MLEQEYSDEVTTDDAARSEPVEANPGDEPVQLQELPDGEENGTNDSENFEIMETTQAPADPAASAEETNNFLLYGGVILLVIAIGVVVAMVVKKFKK